MPGAAGWPRNAHQPVSLPGSLPGNTVSPLFVFVVAYARLTASSCGCVRQLGASTPLHSSAAGSNLHARGLLMRPSFTPSCASHALTAASLSMLSLAAGTAAAGLFTTGT